jgi:hypothetical protein
MSSDLTHEEIYGGNRSGKTRVITTNAPESAPGLWAKFKRAFAPKKTTAPPQQPFQPVVEPRLLVDSYGTLYTRGDRGNLIRCSAKAPKRPKLKKVTTTASE